MNIAHLSSRAINAPDGDTERSGQALTFAHNGHTHPWPSELSRRRFLQAAVGTAVAGAALGTGFRHAPGAAAHEDEAGTPRPIPGGSPGIAGFFGTLFHVWAPGSPGLDADDAEPATITDLNGFSGLAYVSGMVTRTNTKTHEVRQLPFVESDMRFMTGVFRGTDGDLHRGTFALI